MDNYAAIIDVRQFSSAVKHKTIFSVWDSLAKGKGMLLVNDHDPKPLYYQLAAEYPDMFTWRYLEQGPGCWRVEIYKTQVSGVNQETQIGGTD